MSRRATEINVSGKPRNVAGERPEYNRGRESVNMAFSKLQGIVYKLKILQQIDAGFVTDPVDFRTPGS